MRLMQLIHVTRKAVEADKWIHSIDGRLWASARWSKAHEKRLDLSSAHTNPILR